jgi:hypothetical protein
MGKNWSTKRPSSNSIGFLRHTSNISTQSGISFIPSNMILHQNESKMLLLKPGESNRLHVMDLEYGKVVEEWESKLSINDIIPECKDGQQSETNSVIGLNQSCFFRLDGRLKGSKVALATKYANNPEFSAAVTTGKGIAA